VIDFAKPGVHLICYPSAFNVSTGELLMQKSRFLILLFFTSVRRFASSCICTVLCLLLKSEGMLASVC
jgi:hypothetical protein